MQGTLGLRAADPAVMGVTPVHKPCPQRLHPGRTMPSEPDAGGKSRLQQRAKMPAKADSPVESDRPVMLDS